jgi:hypothetical protein
MEPSGQFHVPASLPRGKLPLYTLDWRLSEFENISGRVEKRGVSCRCREMNPGRLAPQVVAMPTELSRLASWSIVTAAAPHLLAAFLLPGNAPKPSYKPRIQRFTVDKINTSDLTLCWTHSIQPTSPQSLYAQGLFNSLSLVISNPPVCLPNNFLSIYGSAVLLLDLRRFFGFLILYTVGRIPWTGDQPGARPLPTQDNTNRE